jgi:SAM-dependent methyltransferase
MTTLSERLAETRWGTYLTAAERRALDRAMELAGAPSTALEVGCEGGRWLQVLADAGWAVIGTDVDREALAVCSERLPQARCIAVSASDSTLPCETASLRLVLVYEVGPVIQSSWFPAEAARVLEPGGLLVCTYYNRSSARGAAYRLLRQVSSRRRREGSTYYTGPSYRSFRNGLRDLRFRIVHEEGLGWCPFTRASESRLIPLCTAAERRLGLRSLPTLSPLVVLVAQREADPAAPNHPRR